MSRVSQAIACRPAGASPLGVELSPVVRRIGKLVTALPVVTLLVSVCLYWPRERACPTGVSTIVAADTEVILVSSWFGCEGVSYQLFSV
jgi:hypothetical protein